jgi:hypothetical protein
MGDNPGLVNPDPTEGQNSEVEEASSPTTDPVKVEMFVCELFKL